MPYDINKKGKTYFVENQMTGKVMGHFKTKKEARQQQKALYVNTPDMKVKMHMNGSFKKGGTVKATGVYKLHKGEKIIASDKE